MDHYQLILGLPHTNHAGLAEHLLLMQAGHFQWTSIARAIGVPLSALRTVSGQAVYATFYYIEERFPEDAPITTFRLDDRLRFALSLRAFKGIAVEGQLLFDRDDRLAGWLAASPAAVSQADIEVHPYIRFANIFITPEAGNARLKVANPAGVRFDGIAKLPNDENPYQLTREAQETGRLGVLTGEWLPLDRVAGFATDYAIDIDRDTNGAGLVYFANYITFMDRAEREAMRTNSRRRFTEADIDGRAIQHRRVAFYGNVATNDRVLTRVRLFEHGQDRSKIAFQYEVRRAGDGALICLSEAAKVVSVASR